MCRLLAYAGEPIYLEELVCKPEHSLVRQSLAAEESVMVTNGDGFGLGWYANPEERAEPGVYREVTPAWSDENLLNLCGMVRSPLFFAHVRAATGTAVARQNCHPFRYGKYLFMHNGQIGGYQLVRRELEALLPDHLYAARKGATDSELLFLLTIAKLEEGAEPVQALSDTLSLAQNAMRERQVKAPLRLVAALSDGEDVHAFRYASDNQPPTLYLHRSPAGTVVASEPLVDRETSSGAPWLTVAPSTAVTVSRGLVRQVALTIQ